MFIISEIIEKILEEVLLNETEYNKNKFQEFFSVPCSIDDYDFEGREIDGNKISDLIAFCNELEIDEDVIKYLEDEELKIAQRKVEEAERKLSEAQKNLVIPSSSSTPSLPDQSSAIGTDDLLDDLDRFVVGSDDSVYKPRVSPQSMPAKKRRDNSSQAFEEFGYGQNIETTQQLHTTHTLLDRFGSSFVRDVERVVEKLKTNMLSKSNEEEASGAELSTQPSNNTDIIINLLLDLLLEQNSPKQTSWVTRVESQQGYRGDKVKQRLEKEVGGKACNAICAAMEKGGKREKQNVTGVIDEVKKHLELESLGNEISLFQEALDNVKQKVEEIESNTEISVTKPYSGIGIRVSYTDDGFLRIDEVGKGSPAERQGFMAGDIITNIGDKEIQSNMNFSEIVKIARGHIGDYVEYKISRNGEFSNKTIRREVIDTDLTPKHFAQLDEPRLLRHSSSIGSYGA